jgi:hypothetical protein
LLNAIADLLTISGGMAGGLPPAMSQFADQLRERTLRFALAVLRFCRTLPTDWEGRFVADQLFRSSARASANYHATLSGAFATRLRVEARDGHRRIG